MNADEAKKLRVKTEVIRRYYVEWPDGSIHDGPFDTKQEAVNSLTETRNRIHNDNLTH